MKTETKTKTKTNTKKEVPPKEGTLYEALGITNERGREIRKRVSSLFVEFEKVSEVLETLNKEFKGREFWICCVLYGVNMRTYSNPFSIMFGSK